MNTNKIIDWQFLRFFYNKVFYHFNMLIQQNTIIYQKLYYVPKIKLIDNKQHLVSQSLNSKKYQTHRLK